MTLGTYSAAGTITFITRILLRDVVTSPATTGKVWSDAQIKEAANQAQRELHSLLLQEPFSELLGSHYREVTNNVTSGNQDFKLSTLSITAEEVTAVKVKYLTAGSYVMADPLTYESRLALSTALKGSKTSPRYALISKLATTWDLYLRIIPAYDADVTAGLVIVCVEQPTDMAADTAIPSLPSQLHHLMPNWTARNCWLAIGETAEAEKLEQGVIASLLARVKGLEEAAGMRKIKPRKTEE